MQCAKCGRDAGGAKFCPGCGASLATVQNTASTSSLAENVAGTLSYLFGWITGIIFLLIDKRGSVRFHAMQSIITFGGLTVLNLLLGRILRILPYSMWGIINPILSLISLVGLVLWILLMVNAFQGKRYKLPILGDLAEKYAGQSGSYPG